MENRIVAYRNGFSVDGEREKLIRRHIDSFEGHTAAVFLYRARRTHENYIYLVSLVDGNLERERAVLFEVTRERVAGSVRSDRARTSNFTADDFAVLGFLNKPVANGYRKLSRKFAVSYSYFRYGLSQSSLGRIVIIGYFLVNGTIFKTGRNDQPGGVKEFAFYVDRSGGNLGNLN